jgi:hypothetical protein
MRTRHLTVVGLLAALLAVGLTAGCAKGTGTPSAGGSSGVSSAPGPSESGGSTPPSAGTSPSATPSSSESTGELTLTGQVEAGVEPKCLILRANGGTYQLVGGDQNVVKVGNNVVVTGHVVTGMMSYCMQGKPFQVTTAHLA